MENKVPQNTPIATVRSTIEDTNGDNYTCFEFSPQHPVEIWNDNQKKTGRIYKSFNRKVMPEKNFSKRNVNQPFELCFPSISVTTLELKKESDLPNTDYLSFNVNIRNKKNKFQKAKSQPNTPAIKMKNNKRTVTNLEYNHLSNITDETKKKVLFIEKELARMQSIKKDVIQTTKSIKKQKKSHQAQTNFNKININSFLNTSTAHKLPSINIPNKNFKQNTPPNQSPRNVTPLNFSKFFSKSNKFPKKLHFETLPKISNKSKLQRIAEEQKILIEENKKLSEENRRLHMEKLELLTGNISKENLCEINHNELTNEVVEGLKSNLQNYQRKYEVPIQKVSNSDIIQLTTDIFHNQNVQEKKWHTPLNLPIQSTASQQSISDLKIKKINTKTQQFITSLEELNKKKSILSTSYLQRCEVDKDQSTTSVIKKIESKPKVEQNHFNKHRSFNYKSIEYYEKSLEMIENSKEPPKRVTFDEKSNIQWIEKVDMKQYPKEKSKSTKIDLTNDWIEKLNNITDNQKIEADTDTISIIYQKSPRLTDVVSAATSSTKSFQNSMMYKDETKAKLNDFQQIEITALEKSDSQLEIEKILSNASNILHRLNLKDKYESNEVANGESGDNFKMETTSPINRNNQELNESSCNTEFNPSLNLSPRSAKLLENTLGCDVYDHDYNLLSKKSTDLSMSQKSINDNEFKAESKVVYKNKQISRNMELQNTSKENTINPKYIEKDIFDAFISKENSKTQHNIENIKFNLKNNLPKTIDDKIPLEMISFSTIENPRQYNRENSLINQEMSKNSFDSRIVRKKIFINPSPNDSVENICTKHETEVLSQHDPNINCLSTIKDSKIYKPEDSSKNEQMSRNSVKCHIIPRKIFINPTPNSSENICIKNESENGVSFQNVPKKQINNDLIEDISTNSDFDDTETTFQNNQTNCNSETFSISQTDSQTSIIDVNMAKKIKQANAKLVEENKILLDKLHAEQSKNKQLELAKNLNQNEINKSSLELFTQKKAKEFIHESIRLNKFNRRIEKVINKLEESNSSFMDFYNNKKKVENIVEKKREPLIGVYNEFLKTSTDDFAEAEKLFTPLMSKKDSIPKLPHIIDKGHGDHQSHDDYFTRSANLIKLATCGEGYADSNYFNTRSQKKNLSVHFNNNPYSSTCFWESSNLPQIATLQTKYVPKYSKSIVKNSQKEKFPSIYVTELKNDKNSNIRDKCSNFPI